MPINQSDPRYPILSKIYSYTSFTDGEETMKQQLITFIEAHPDCFKRTLRIGHVTGSAWIVSPDYTVALLTHHGKLDKWFQLGGHSDGDPDTFQVALREAQEESGLNSLQAYSQDIFDIDIHPIPQKGTESDHLHYDIRFLFIADPSESLQVSDESHDVQWVPLKEIAQLNPSDSITRMVEKTRQLKKRQ